MIFFSDEFLSRNPATISFRGYYSRCCGCHNRHLLDPNFRCCFHNHGDHHDAFRTPRSHMQVLPMITTRRRSTCSLEARVAGRSRRNIHSKALKSRSFEPPCGVKIACQDLPVFSAWPGWVPDNCGMRNRERATTTVTRDQSVDRGIGGEKVGRLAGRRRSKYMIPHTENGSVRTGSLRRFQQTPVRPASKVDEGIKRPWLKVMVEYRLDCPPPPRPL